MNKRRNGIKIETILFLYFKLNSKKRNIIIKIKASSIVKKEEKFIFVNKLTLSIKFKSILFPPYSFVCSKIYTLCFVKSSCVQVISVNVFLL